MDAALRRPDFGAERINVPAIPNYYWRYRMHLPLETLGRAETFKRLGQRHGQPERAVDSRAKTQARMSVTTRP